MLLILHMVVAEVVRPAVPGPHQPAAVVRAARYLHPPAPVVDAAPAGGGDRSPARRTLSFNDAGPLGFGPSRTGAVGGQRRCERHSEPPAALRTPRGRPASPACSGKGRKRRGIHGASERNEDEPVPARDAAHPGIGSTAVLGLPGHHGGLCPARRVDGAARGAARLGSHDLDLCGNSRPPFPGGRSRSTPPGAGQGARKAACAAPLLVLLSPGRRRRPGVCRLSGRDRRIPAPRWRWRRAWAASPPRSRSATGRRCWPAWGAFHANLAFLFVLLSSAGVLQHGPTW